MVGVFMEIGIGGNMDKLKTSTTYAGPSSYEGLEDKTPLIERINIEMKETSDEITMEGKFTVTVTKRIPKPIWYSMEESTKTHEKKWLAGLVEFKIIDLVAKTIETQGYYSWNINKWPIKATYLGNNKYIAVMNKEIFEMLRLSSKEFE